MVSVRFLVVKGLIVVFRFYLCCCEFCRLGLLLVMLVVSMFWLVVKLKIGISGVVICGLLSCCIVGVVLVWVNELMICSIDFGV